MNLKIGTPIAAAFALASLVGMGAEAYARSSNDGLNRWVEIINSAPYAIVSLEAINVDYVGSWHSYLSRVRPGGSASAYIDDGMGYCRFDVYVVFADGADDFAENVNVCDTYGLEFA